MLKRLSLFVVLALLTSVFILPVTAQDATPSPTGTPRAGIQPVDVTPTPTPRVVSPVREGLPDEIDGTPIAPPPVAPPPTLDDLFERYPDLAPYVAELDEMVVEDIDFAELYEHIVTIFDEEGGAGLAAFLNESGIMEKLGLPLSYLDLLTEYDEGGLLAVEELARVRGIINDNDELVGYLAIDARENVDEATEALEDLGVSVYAYLPNTDELEIGIPLDILAQYQTPGTMIDYLVTIANAPHVVGFRGPVGHFPTSPSFQADSVNGDYINTDAWNAAGYSGQGVRVGVLDVGGFGRIQSMIQAGELPSNIVGNYPLNQMEQQASDHGTACAIVIHRVAPNAELFVAYYDGTDTSFFNALQFFVDNQVDVINYSGGSSVGPRDGTWGQSMYVNEFVRQTGILWVNSAGNEAMSHSMWYYTPGDDGWQDFGNGSGDYWLPYIANGNFGMVALNWPGNWNGGEATNFTFIVHDGNDNEIAVAAEARNGGRNHFPFQFTAFETVPGEIYYIAIQGGSGAVENTILDIFATRGTMADWAVVPQYSVSIPGDASSSLTVAATGRASDVLEPYSSQGPRMDNENKPDIAAPTGEQMPGYTSQFGFNGTSGAAPLVAGAAALVMEAFPNMSAQEVKAYLMTNVVDVGDSGTDPQFGTGILMMPELGAEPTQPGPEPTRQPGPGPGPGPQPTAQPSGSASATLLDQQVQYGVRSGGDTGMQVTLSFQVDGMLDKDIAVVMLFGDGQGNALATTDEDYQLFGTIGTGFLYTVQYDQSVFSDVVLFIPDRLFTDLPVGTELTYWLAILDLSDSQNIRALWESELFEIAIVG